MYLKIHFEDKPLYLCDARTPEMEEILRHPDTMHLDEDNHHAIKAVLHKIGKPEFHAAVMETGDLEGLFKRFKRHFVQMDAAGGLVSDGKGRHLFIRRRGKWDLPKGKLDEGETLEACAVREVEEETGLRFVERGDRICTTYHTYEQFGKRILKASHWFRMQADGEQVLKPQAEEDITETVWLDPASILKILPDSYASIREVVAMAGII